MNLYVIEIKQDSKRNHFYERALYLIEAKTESRAEELALENFGENFAEDREPEYGISIKERVEKTGTEKIKILEVDLC